MPCFLRAISLGRLVVPSSKIAINLPMTYEKLRFKGEPYRFSAAVSQILWYRQTETRLFLYKDRLIETVKKLVKVFGEKSPISSKFCYDCLIFREAIPVSLCVCVHFIQGH